MINTDNTDAASQKSGAAYLGPLFMAASAALFSLSGLFIKLVPWSAVAVNGARNLIGACVIGIFMLMTRRKLHFTPAVFLGAAAMAGTTTLFSFANKLTTSANAIVLQFTAPVFIIFFMWLFFREKPGRLDAVTCAAVLAGIVLFFVDGLSAGGTLGNILSLISGVTYAFVFMIGTFRGSDPLSSVILGQLLCGVTCTPFVALETDFSAETLLIVLCLGVFQLGVAYIFFSIGLRTTKAVTASLVSGIEPILNPVWTAIFYNERLSATALAGGVLVIGSILIYNMLKAKYADSSKS